MASLRSNRRGVFQLFIVAAILFVFLFAWGIVAKDVLPTFLDNAIASVQGQPWQEGTEFWLRMYTWAPPIIVVIGLIAWGLSK